MKYLIIIFCLLFLEEARSCTCIGESIVKKEVRKSNLVFRGILINSEKIVIDSLYEGKYIYNYIHTFKTRKVYKGKYIGEANISVVSGTGNGDCGLSFQVGTEYVVYTTTSNRFLPDGKKVDKFNYTDVCMRSTTEIEVEEELIKEVRNPRKWALPK